MKLKIEVVKEAQRKEDEKSVSLELHSQRGDIWNCDRTMSIPEGQSSDVVVPNNGRLVIVGPDVGEPDVVYDPDQKAAVRRENAGPNAGTQSSIGDPQKVDQAAKHNVSSQNPNTRSTNPPAGGVGSQPPGGNLRSDGAPNVNQPESSTMPGARVTPSTPPGQPGNPVGNAASTSSKNDDTKQPTDKK